MLIELYLWQDPLLETPQSRFMGQDLTNLKRTYIFDGEFLIQRSNLNNKLSNISGTKMIL